jgi:hypothetical protein
MRCKTRYLSTISPVSNVPPKSVPMLVSQVPASPRAALALPAGARAAVAAPVVPAVTPAPGPGTAISVTIAWPAKSNVSMTEPKLVVRRASWYELPTSSVTSAPSCATAIPSATAQQMIAPAKMA